MTDLEHDDAHFDLLAALQCWAPIREIISSDTEELVESGEEPAMFVANATKTFKMGLALFQSHREGHRLIRPEELDATLQIKSV